MPVVNLDDHLDAPNLSMATCGWQAMVPIVAAIATAGLASAEIISSISAKSIGLSTRANIDECIKSPPPHYDSWAAAARFGNTAIF